MQNWGQSCPFNEMHYDDASLPEINSKKRNFTASHLLTANSQHQVVRQYGCQINKIEKRFEKLPFIWRTDEPECIFQRKPCDGYNFDDIDCFTRVGIRCTVVVVDRSCEVK